MPGLMVMVGVAGRELLAPVVENAFGGLVIIERLCSVPELDRGIGEGADEGCMCTCG